MCEGNNYIERAIKDLDSMIEDSEKQKREFDKQIEGYLVAKSGFLKKLEVMKKNSSIATKKPLIENHENSDQKIFANKQENDISIDLLEHTTNKYHGWTATDAIMDFIETQPDKEKQWRAKEINNALKKNGLNRSSISSDLQRLSDKQKLEKIESENSNIVWYKLLSEEQKIIMQLSGKYKNWSSRDAIMDFIENHHNKNKEWSTQEVKAGLKENGLISSNISSDCSRLAKNRKLERIEIGSVNKYKLPKKSRIGQILEEHNDIN